MRTQSPRETFILGLGLDAPPAGESIDHSPSYNLERNSGIEGFDSILHVISAVAGFALEQLEISVAGDQLSSSGKQNAGGDLQQDCTAELHTAAFGMRDLMGRVGVEPATFVRGLLSLDSRQSARGSRTIEVGVRDM